MAAKKIIILAGGSGGHVFPGLTIAKYLIKKGWKVKWIGARKNIESILIPQNGININYIEIKGLRNSNWLNLIYSPIFILKACYQAKKIIKQWSPDIVLGMGGYVSGPGGIAAWISKLPFILHEQNKISGLTNQWLAKISQKNMQAFPGVLQDAEVVGNPIRESIIKIPKPVYRFKNRTGPLRVLVVGGSQGASILNCIFPEVSFLLQKKIIIWHQVGNNELEKTQKKYNKFGYNQHVITRFIENIASAYQWADIIVSRSGALTVSEVSVVGLGAIFIPYPHKDKQQYLNAQDLENIGAAKIIDQSQINSQLIAGILYSLNREELFYMAEKSYSLGFRDATSKIYKIIKHITYKK